MTQIGREDLHYDCYTTPRPSDYLRRDWCQGSYYAWNLDTGRVESDNPGAASLDPQEYCMTSAVDEWMVNYGCASHGFDVGDAIVQRLSEVTGSGQYAQDWAQWQDQPERTLLDVLAVVEGAEVEVLGPKPCAASRNGVCPDPATVAVMSSLHGYARAFCSDCAQVLVADAPSAESLWSAPL